MRPEHARAVVTGLGVRSGLGRSVPAFWSGLEAGRSCLRRWPDPDPRVASKVGGPFGDFSLDVEVPDPDARRVLSTTGRWTQLAACAALEAASGSGAVGQIEPARFAHVAASQDVSLGWYADRLPAFRVDPDRIDPLTGLVALDSDPVAAIGELLDLRGPTSLVGGACASGNLAILTGLDLIRSGRADAVLVTGAPFPTHPMILHGLAMIEAISFRSFDDAPEEASRPFDARREGFVPSEGAAAVVLESLAHARARGAPIRAEILGGASTSDACRLPKPHADGQVRAIRRALADADLEAADVDYVNAHATSTPLGDAVEVGALKVALGRRAYEVPVNSTKSMIGHGITSAAVLELVATVLQMERGVVHPTINQDQPDPELDLDFVPNRARPHRIRAALSNSFGFGGINSCVAVGVVR